MISIPIERSADSRAALVPPRAGVLAAVRARPLLCVALGTIAAGLGWLVATTTLPYALATRTPERALALNPRNPDALLSRAEQYRKDLVALLTAKASEVGPAKLPAIGTPTPSDGASAPVGRFSAPLTPGARDDTAERIKILRDEIRALLQRVIVHDPLNPQAYRLLGALETDPDRMRAAMEAAAARSRRERTALLWLVHDSYTRGDEASAIAYADALMRADRSMARYVTGYLVQLTATPEGRAQIADYLTAGAPWRERFLVNYAMLAPRPRVLLELLLELKQRGSPPTPLEEKTVVDAFVQRGQTALAYNIWLQMRSPDELQRVRRINNGDFEGPARAVAFDWHIANARNAVVEIAADPVSPGNHALHLQFNGARADAIGVSQIVLTRPGDYELRGEMRGALTTKTGLRWQVLCRTGKALQLGHSRLLTGASEAWEAFRVPFTVPAGDTCASQQIVLSHETVSASERMIGGDIWFDNLELVPLAGGNAAPPAGQPR